MEMEINKVLVKENHIKHICKLFIIFVQLFFYVEIGWKRGEKMLDNVCLCHTSTFLYIHTIEYLYNLKEFVLNFNFLSSLENPVKQQNGRKRW